MSAREREDVDKDRKNHMKINIIDEIREPCFTWLAKQNLMKLLKKSKMCSSKQYALLQKGCQKGDLIEFHVDDSDVFTEIEQDWSLKVATCIGRNPTSKMCIVFGQEEIIYLPHSLKIIIGLLSVMRHSTIKLKGLVWWSVFLNLKNLDGLLVS